MFTRMEETVVLQSCFTSIIVVDLVRSPSVVMVVLSYVLLVSYRNYNCSNRKDGESPCRPGLSAQL